MNSSLPSSEFIPHGCEVYEVMGGRLHQPSILTQASLIIVIVVIILTSRLASLNRFNCRGPCTALIRRFDENNLT